jgi:para-nitrobenzyl esterase
MKMIAPFFLLIMISFIGFAQADHAAPQVKTTHGTLEGIDLSGVSVFKGIPFAAPPVGDLRWKAPQPLQPWTGVRQCKTFGPSPMQNSPVPFSMWSAEFLIPKEPISEDCLYLNVWSGARSNAEKRPVLVWIYGGGFNSGGSAVPIYDGEAMAAKGIVFVSLNYRVGVFGFLAHPQLSAESGHQASGNYGLLDQIAALQWVQKNIAAFGGDPSNVTIAGQSAGSISVNCLVASPLAKGLFQKAIAQSGALFAGNSPILSTAEQNGINIQKQLGAASIADMRRLPADSLLKKGAGMYRPVVDGYVLPDAIANIFKAGKQNDVALLTGWNQDEGLLFGPVKSASDYRKQAAQQYAADSTLFLKYYPGSTDAEAAASQLNLSRDMIFGVQNFAWANLQSSQGKKVYVYRFTRKVPATGEYKKYGAFHTGEVPYVFDNLQFVNRPWEQVDREMAKTMSAYWVNFVATGDPNGNGLPAWPMYATSDKKILLLGEKQEAVSLPDDSSLQFLYQKMTTQQ